MEKVKRHDACTEVDENEPAGTTGSAAEVWPPVTSAMIGGHWRTILRVSSRQVALLIAMPSVYHYISKSIILAITELEVHLQTISESQYILNN